MKVHRVSEASRAIHPRFLAVTLHLPSTFPGRGSPPFLEIDLLLEDRAAVTAMAEIAWCEPIPDGEPGRFDLGLRLVQVERTGGEARGRPEGVETLARRERELREALAGILGSRDAFMAALRSDPTSEAILPEEARYLSAIRAARVALGETATSR